LAAHTQSFRVLRILWGLTQRHHELNIQPNRKQWTCGVAGTSKEKRGQKNVIKLRKDQVIGRETASIGSEPEQVTPSGDHREACHVMKG